VKSNHRWDSAQLRQMKNAQGQANDVVGVHNIRPELIENLGELAFHGLMKEIRILRLIVFRQEFHAVYRQALVVVHRHGMPVTVNMSITSENSHIPTPSFQAKGLLVRDEFGAANKVWRINVAADKDSTQVRPPAPAGRIARFRPLSA
jgi:hypothetical protein